MSAIAFLQRQNLFLYYTDRDVPVGGDIPIEAVRDMEVRSVEALGAWIKQNIPKDAKGKVQTVLLIDESLCYMLELGDRNEEESKKQLLSLAPFAHISTAIVSVKDKRYVIATNQDLYQKMIRALSESDHIVSLVIPSAALFSAGINLDGGINGQVAKRVTDSVSSLRNHAFDIHEQKLNVSPVSTSEEKHQVQKKKTLSLWWIVFGTAALLYVVVMYVMFLRS